MRCLIFVFILMLFVSPAHALWAGKPAACTRDARVCPDGTTVGRIGPDCEFAPCPDGNVPADTAPGIVEGSAGEGGTDEGEGGGTSGAPAESLPPDSRPDSGHAVPPQPAPDVPEGGQRMCTMEAKICPDGTGVGRTGPNCEFAPCPGEEKE